MQLASFYHTNLGQGLKRKTRCNDTMNVMSEREFVLAISFKGLNDDPVDYDLVYIYITRPTLLVACQCLSFVVMSLFHHGICKFI